MTAEDEEAPHIGGAEWQGSPSFSMMARATVLFSPDLGVVDDDVCPSTAVFTEHDPQGSVDAMAHHQCQHSDHEDTDGGVLIWTAKITTMPSKHGQPCEGSPSDGIVR